LPVDENLCDFNDVVLNHQLSSEVNVFSMRAEVAKLETQHIFFVLG
jgi:hypothetical protein